MTHSQLDNVHCIVFLVFLVFFFLLPGTLKRLLSVVSGSFSRKRNNSGREGERIERGLGV